MFSNLLTGWVWSFRWKLMRFWLKLYAADYHGDLEREGLPWTLELIDEDEDLIGMTYSHTLVRAGCIAYAEDRGMVASPYNPRSTNGQAATAQEGGYGSQRQGD